jgi:probable HAF family extracellular repeat protein
MEMRAIRLAVLVLGCALGASAQGTYTQIDYPASIRTTPTGINARGDVVGSYEDQNSVYHGFLLQDGRYISIDYPGFETLAYSVNDVGQVVGTYIAAPSKGFVYDIGTGIFTILYVPGSNATSPTGINNSGMIAGYFYATRSGSNLPAGYQYSTSKFREILPPPYLIADAWGINNIWRLHHCR